MSRREIIKRLKRLGITADLSKLSSFDLNAIYMHEKMHREVVAIFKEKHKLQFFRKIK